MSPISIITVFSLTFLLCVSCIELQNKFIKSDREKCIDGILYHRVEGKLQPKWQPNGSLIECR